MLNRGLQSKQAKVPLSSMLNRGQQSEQPKVPDGEQHNHMASGHEFSAWGVDHRAGIRTRKGRLRPCL